MGYNGTSLTTYNMYIPYTFICGEKYWHSVRFSGFSENHQTAKLKTHTVSPAIQYWKSFCSSSSVMMF